MRRFLLRRLLLSLPILLGITFLTFMLVRVGGLDPVGLLAGPTASAREIAMIRAELQLDQPLGDQFLTYLGHVARGDLGNSWLTNRPVLRDLVARAPITLELLLLGVGLAALIGIPVGLKAAFNPDGKFDQVSRVVSLFGFSIPTYWLGLVAIFVFFYLLRWAPPPMGRMALIITPPPTITGSYLLDSLITGNKDAALSALSQLVLPVLTLTVIASAPIIKQTRAIAVEVLSSDFIRYAHCSGLPRGAVRRMVLRNSLTPVLTFIGTEITGLVGTSSLIELIFSWGGLGQYGLNAILSGDFTAVQGYVLLVALFSFVVFLVIDLLVVLLEPRAALQ